MSRYKAYPEYKDSGVEWLGEIPVGWEAKRLGHFFEERREKVSDKDYPPLSVTMQGIVPQLETAAKTEAGDNRKLAGRCKKLRTHVQPDAHHSVSHDFIPRNGFSIPF